MASYLPDGREYRWIPGFKPYYVITEDGCVFSYVTNKWLTPFPNTNGRLRVRLNLVTPRNYQIHILVAWAFIGPPPFTGALVLHDDGNHVHNHYTNLKYGTFKDNWQDMERHGRTSRGEIHGQKALGGRVQKGHTSRMRAFANRDRLLEEMDVKDIYLRLLSGFRICDLAKEYAVGPHVILAIKSKKCWKWLTDRLDADMGVVCD